MFAKGEVQFVSSVISPGESRPINRSSGWLKTALGNLISEGPPFLLSCREICKTHKKVYSSVLLASSGSCSPFVALAREDSPCVDASSLRSR